MSERKKDMEDFTMAEMRSMQQQLQERYRSIWEPVCPETGGNKLLWMLGEVGEVIDILKKSGSTSISEDPAVREHFVEELADVLMYYNDVLLCFDITPEELKHRYVEKFQRNLKRW